MTKQFAIFLLCSVLAMSSCNRGQVTIRVKVTDGAKPVSGADVSFTCASKHTAKEVAGQAGTYEVRVPDAPGGCECDPKNNGGKPYPVTVTKAGFEQQANADFINDCGSDVAVKLSPKVEAAQKAAEGQVTIRIKVTDQANPATHVTKASVKFTCHEGKERIANYVKDDGDCSIYEVAVPDTPSGCECDPKNNGGVPYNVTVQATGYNDSKNNAINDCNSDVMVKLTKPKPAKKKS